ncbi:c-type cytochrome [Granulicella tundricola]|uniref:Cytochrome c class I n=1 Tax=Granulicella tundricola (strain ATCC BAA-1859 / DSM 23138 / MP5ACTX9) TaxID=1198114 RepID=E8WX42_GRATM|nr:c-type cytochrome [Granulicella tundricola]ADW69684.1 cytochrome c class I [Granulicella tundricola MP5ACTX9]
MKRVRERWIVVAVVALTVSVYGGAILASLLPKHLSLDLDATTRQSKLPWRPPPVSSIPDNPHGDSIRRGALLFDETPLYAAAFTGAKVSCANCHAEGGIQPLASPVVGLPAKFPMYNERAGHMISLKDRVQECFVRSENGTPLDYDGTEMKGLVDYIEWLSIPQPGRRAFEGRGLVKLPELTPDPIHGGQIFAAQCAGCHGEDGQGKPPKFPPVWGPQSFNDGAGMHGVRKMASFVQHNMPQNRMGILTPQEAWDVSAFIHAQPRPAFNTAYKKF